MKLNHKISFVVFLASFIVLTSFYILHEFVSHEAAIKDTSHKIKNLSTEISSHIDTFFKEKISKAKTLANTPLIISSLEKSNEYYSDFEKEIREEKIKSLNETWMSTNDKKDQFLKNYLQNTISGFLRTHIDLLPGEYGEIFLTNRYGAVVATTEKLTTFAHAHKTWWKECFNNGTGRVFIDDRGYDESVEGYVVGIVVPVMMNDDVIGVLKCNINVKDTLFGFINNFSLRESGGELCIARSNGLIIIDKKKDPLSSKLNEDILSKIKTNEFNNDFFIDKKENIIAWNKVKSTQGSNNLKFGGTKKTIDQNKGNEGEIWLTIIKIPTKNVLAQLHKSDTLHLYTIGIASIFLIIASLYFGQKLTRPVKALTIAAKKVGEGDTSIKIDLTGDDEISQLSHEFNKMTQNLNRSNAEKEQLMKDSMRSAQLAAIGRLSANIAHEINNPTQAIIGFAELIEDSPNDPKSASEFSKRIKQEGLKIGDLVRTALHYTRKGKTEFDELNISEVVDNAIFLLKGRLKQENISLDVDLPESLPKVHVCAREIEQVIINLVQNSVDALASMQNQPPKTITITGRKDTEHNSLCVGIKDNGPGMSPDKLNRAKETFYTTKPEGMGTGLGLAIVDEIMKNHGGSFQLASVEGEFTEAVLLFPLPDV